MKLNKLGPQKATAQRFSTMFVIGRKMNKSKNIPGLEKVSTLRKRFEKMKKITFLLSIWLMFTLLGCGASVATPAPTPIKVVI
jgi:hypothetical protein